MGRGSRQARGAIGAGTLRVIVRGPYTGRIVGVSESAHRSLRTPTDEAGPSHTVRTPSPPPRDPSPSPQAEEPTPDVTQEPSSGPSGGSSSSEESESWSSDSTSSADSESESQSEQAKSAEESKAGDDEDTSALPEPEPAVVPIPEEEEVEEEEDEQLERRSKRRVNRVSLIHTPSSRAATSTTDLHLLPVGIEEAVVRPTVHSHGP